ncbi:hypothetical protein CDAR_517491 [Caerostris darwini]|uniref:Uncharacterized protein n=1 Tax=Caerostris darwini TaxID=1538125 RepID=A0AAV4PM87_9ARAC|nr:hypothetical protein CDAR_517491 [Caerostris darwini]
MYLMRAHQILSDGNVRSNSISYENVSDGNTSDTIHQYNSTDTISMYSYNRWKFRSIPISYENISDRNTFLPDTVSDENVDALMYNVLMLEESCLILDYSRGGRADGGRLPRDFLAICSFLLSVDVYLEELPSRSCV